MSQFGLQKLMWKTRSSLCLFGHQTIIIIIINLFTAVVEEWKTNLMSLFYFTYYVLSTFRTLIYPSSGACDCVDELPHRSSCSQFVVCWSFWCGWYLVVFVLQAEACKTYRYGNNSYNLNFHRHMPLFKAIISISEKKEYFAGNCLYSYDQSCRRKTTTPSRLSSAVNMIHLLLHSPSGRAVFFIRNAKTCHALLWQPC